MFEKYKKQKQEKIDLLVKNQEITKKEQEICDDIENEETQINLIKEIQLGNITFNKIPETIIHKKQVSYYEKRWESVGGLIKMWFEDTGSMSFTYLSVDEIQLKEELKYYTQIAWAIQNIETEIELDWEQKLFTDPIPTFEDWFNPKPKKKTKKRFLKNGIITIKEV